MQRPKLTKVITFRVSDEEWFGIQRAAEECGITPNEWCRTMAVERLDLWCGLSQSQVVLFGQIARARFLVESALALLAENNLQSHVWKSYRIYARGNLNTILEQALTECSQRRQELARDIDASSD